MLPELTLSCLTGGAPVVLREVAGPAVITVWASWCPPCRKDLPAFQPLSERAPVPLQVVGLTSRAHRGGPQSLREAFAARVRAELGVPARAVADPGSAVAGRDLVVLATTSPTPVLCAADLSPGTHVNAVGFKQRDRSEFGTDLLDTADLLVTDSPAQAADYQPPMLAATPPYAGRLRDLGGILAGAVPGRTTADQISVFCSTGLAGTEVFLLDALTRVAAAAR
ncbi:Ornithine cyclodeaminase [Micromonospora saelicesensis]|nr:Ornithine cyclodeaminase [Micromonospora saelicesensis]